MTGRIFLTLGAFLLALAACSQETSIPPMQRHGVIQLSDAFDMDFDLIDHDGAPATDERFEGNVLFAYYGFASCPDVCPAALSVMAATLQQLGSSRDDVQALFITVDPERDTPEVLKAHLSFASGILGLTGTEETARAARDAMKVYAARVEMPDSAIGYTMDHQSLFYVIDRQGHPVVALQDDMAPSDIAAVLREVAEK